MSTSCTLAPAFLSSAPWFGADACPNRKPWTRTFKSWFVVFPHRRHAPAGTCSQPVSGAAEDRIQARLERLPGGPSCLALLSGVRQEQARCRLWPPGELSTIALTPTSAPDCRARKTLPARPQLGLAARGGQPGVRARPALSVSCVLRTQKLLSSGVRRMPNRTDLPGAGPGHSRRASRLGMCTLRCVLYCCCGCENKCPQSCLKRPRPPDRARRSNLRTGGLHSAARAAVALRLVFLACLRSRWLLGGPSRRW